MAKNLTAIEIINKNASLSFSEIYGYNGDGLPILNAQQVIDWKNDYAAYLQGTRTKPNIDIYDSPDVNNRKIIDDNSPHLVGYDSNGLSFFGKTTKENSLFYHMKKANELADDLYEKTMSNPLQTANLFYKLEKINQKQLELNDIIKNKGKLSDIEKCLIEIEIYKISIEDFVNKNTTLESERIALQAHIYNSAAEKNIIQKGDYTKNLNNTISYINNLQSHINNNDISIADIEQSQDHTNIELLNLGLKEIEDYVNIPINDMTKNQSAFLYEKLFNAQIEHQKNHTSTWQGLTLEDEYVNIFNTDKEFMKSCIDQMPSLFQTTNDEQLKKVSIELTNKTMLEYFNKDIKSPDNLLRNTVMLGDKLLEVVNHIDNSENKSKEIEKCYRILLEKSDIFEKALLKAQKENPINPEKINEIKEELTDLYINQIHNLTSTLCNNNPNTLSHNQAGISYKTEVSNCLKNFLNEEPKINGSCLFQMLHSLPMAELENNGIVENILKRFEIDKDGNLGNLTIDDADLLQGLLSHKDFDLDGKNSKHLINGQSVHEYLKDNKDTFMLHIQSLNNPHATKVYKETRFIINSLNNTKNHDDFNMFLECSYQKNKTHLMAAINDYKEDFGSYSLETKVYMGVMIAFQAALFTLSASAKLVLGTQSTIKSNDGEKIKRSWKIIENKETGEFDVMMKVESQEHKGLLEWKKIGNYEYETKKFNADVDILNKYQNQITTNQSKELDNFVSSAHENNKSTPKQSSAARKINHQSEIER